MNIKVKDCILILLKKRFKFNSKKFYNHDAIDFLKYYKNKRKNYSFLLLIYLYLKFIINKKLI